MGSALHPEADELRGIYLFSVLDDEQLKAILDTTRVVRLAEFFLLAIRTGEALQNRQRRW